MGEILLTAEQIREIVEKQPGNTQTARIQALAKKLQCSEQTAWRLLAQGVSTTASIGIRNRVQRMIGEVAR